MAQHARPPPELSVNGPMDENWRTWKQQFLIFLKVSGTVNESEDTKSNLLLNLIGQVGVQIYGNFTFDSPTDNENLDIILKKFDDHFDPKESEAHERYVFFTTRKKDGETIEQYVNRMRIKAKTCNFGELTDSLIRDKILLDVKDKAVRQHMLSESDLSLSQTIILWQSYEPKEKLLQLCEVKVKNQPSSSKPDNRAKNNKSGCRKCGVRHEFKKCPAFGKKCEKCGQLNHFTQFCGNAPPVKNNAKDKTDAQNKNINPGPFTQIPAKVMNKDAMFKNNIL